jgi:hypothetical protein
VKRLLVRPKRRWHDNIRIDLEGIVVTISNSSGSVKGPVADSFEHGNETSVSIKGREFPDWLSDYQLLKKDCAP